MTLNYFSATMFDDEVYSRVLPAGYFALNITVIKFLRLAVKLISYQSISFVDHTQFSIAIFLDTHFRIPCPHHMHDTNAIHTSRIYPSPPPTWKSAATSRDLPFNQSHRSLWPYNKTGECINAGGDGCSRAYAGAQLRVFFRMSSDLRLGPPNRRPGCLR